MGLPCRSSIACRGAKAGLQTMPPLISRADLLKSRLDRFARALSGIERGDVRALHRARVASRRIRELIPVLQLDRDTTRKLSRRLRRVTMRLGTVRELDVLLILKDQLHLSRPDLSAALGRVGMIVAKERDEARKHLLDRLPVSELRKIGRKLERAVEELAAADPRRGRTAAQGLRWALEARIAKRASRLRDSIESAGALYLPDRLHDVRIALKKLRYAIELHAHATDRDRNAELRVLRRGQEVLGRLHDLEVLLDRVRQVQASMTPSNLGVWRDLDGLVESIDEDCRRLHARYMRARGAVTALAETLSVPPVTPKINRTSRIEGGPVQTPKRRAG